MRGSVGAVHARILLCTIALALLAIAALPAQGQVDVESQFNVQGRYEGDGFEITLPDGWRGTAEPTGKVLVAVPQETLDAVNTSSSFYMFVQIGWTPKTGWEWIDANVHVEGCTINSAAFTEINGAGAKVIDASCDPDAMASINWFFSEGRMYQFFANQSGEERLYYALAWATSREILDAHIPSVDQMMNSIQIDGIADIKSEQPDLYSLEVEEKTVRAQGQDVMVRVQSDSAVKDFSLDEATRTLSFKADADHAEGQFTVISVSSVLEGPYQVMIDGEVADDSKYYMVEDEQSGETDLVVRHGPGQEVAIIGTQVVPEFPAAVAGVLAIVLAVSIIATRSKTGISKG